MKSQYWSDTLGNPERIGGLAYAGNQSIRGFLERVATPAGMGVLWLTMVLLVLVLVAVAMRRVLLAGSPAGAVALNALVALLCSPVSWTHHWVWLLPALILLAATASRAATSDAGWRFPTGTGGLAGALAVAVLVAVVVAPHWYLPHTAMAERSWPVLMWPLGNSYVILAAVLVGAALGHPTLFRGAAGDPVTASQRGRRRVLSRTAAAIAVALVVLYVGDYRTTDLRIDELGSFLRLRESAAVLGTPIPLFREPFHLFDAAFWPAVSPAGAALFTPLLWLTVELGLLIAIGSTVAALVVTLRILFGAITDRNAWAALALVFAFSLLVHPVREAFAEGDLALVLLALVVVDVFHRSPRWPRGLLVGLAGAMAGWPILAAFAFGVRRDRTALVNAFGIAVVAMIASLVLLPADTRGYLRMWLMLPESAVGTFPAVDGSGNLGAFAVLARLGIMAPWAAWLLAAVLFAVVAVAGVRLARPNPALAQALFVASPPLVMPVAVPAVWVFALPLLGLLVWTAVRTRTSAVVTLAWAGILLFAFVWLPDRVRHISGGVAGSPWSVALEVYAAAPTLFVLVATVWAVCRPRDLEWAGPTYTAASWRRSGHRLHTFARRAATGTKALWLRADVSR